MPASPSGRGQARSEAQRQERVACTMDDIAGRMMSPVRARPKRYVHTLLQKGHTPMADINLDDLLKAKQTDAPATEPLPVPTAESVEKAVAQLTPEERNKLMAMIR